MKQFSLIVFYNYWNRQSNKGVIRGPQRCPQLFVEVLSRGQGIAPEGFFAPMR
jgi:hypothetical protein